MEAELESWLLDSDPSLRWQVERDLLDAPEAQWQATRARVANEGFGAALLAKQDPDGQWAGGAYFPGDFDWHGPEAAEGAGQPWTATTWTLNTLRDWGLEAAALGDTAARLGANSRWEYENLPYWGGEVDCCINGFTLANGAWLGADVSGIAQWFIDHQLDDGGWNCEWVNGSTRSSVDSTLNSLKGILDYEQAGFGSPALADARHRGEEYLLERRVMFRKRDGKPIWEKQTQLVYPFRWTCRVLHAADYFRAAAIHDGTNMDDRLQEAVDSIRSQRQSDGTWLQGGTHPGRVWFEVDVPVGEPSKWLTFHALRVLRQWDNRTPGN